MVVTASDDSVLGNLSNLIKSVAVMHEVQCNQSNMLMGEFDIIDKLSPLMSLGVFSIGNNDLCDFKLCQNFSGESRWTIFASNVIILDVAPTKKMAKSKGNSCFSTSNGCNWYQYDVVAHVLRCASKLCVFLAD